MTPANAQEARIAAVAAEVLGRPEIGREEDFFALSVLPPAARRQLATLLATRLREATGLDLPLGVLLTHPTVAALAEWAGASRSNAAAPPIESAAAHSEIPLTYGQQRLWFLRQLDPGSTTYNVPLTLDLAGDLNVAALRASLAAIERRHGILRARFDARDGQPFQRFAPSKSANLPRIDLDSLPRARRPALAARLAEAEGRRPFDLAAGPVWHSRLLRLEPLRHRLVLTLDHMVCDGWSIEILLRELKAHYDRFVTGGKGAPLPAPVVQYGDFALWQSRHFGREAVSGPLESWKRRLAGHLSVLDLTVERPLKTAPGEAGETLSTGLPVRLLEAVRDCCRRQGVSPFVALLAVFEILLSRYAGRDEFLVGTPVANRTRTELQGVIGYFANTLALPATLSPAISFRQLLVQVREVTVEALRHEDLPLEMLVQELAPDRGQADLPLLQTMFTYHTAPTAVPALLGLEMHLIEVDVGGARFDLSLAGLEVPNGLRILLEYRTDLLSRPAARRLLGHFATLLEAAVADPERRLEDLPLLTEAERHRLLFADAGSGPPPAAEGLYDLFAAQAARTPQATAVVGATERLTYAELAARAQGIAERLRALGMGPESTVGVCLRRSPDLIAALLGVLQAGAAYVPLDPAYPAERLAFMLADSGATVVIADAAGRESVAEGKARVVRLPLEAAPAEGAWPASSPAGPGNLAYVIYTSGSTGRPKGVAIEHASAAAFVRWAGEVFGTELAAGVLASTSVCFDLSIFEIFATLGHGGRVILVENALELASRPEIDEVALINTVPSALSELIRLGAVPRSIRTVNLAGEALGGRLVFQIYRDTAAERVFNLYGPSEDTTYSLFSRVGEGEPTPAIGRPVAGTRALVLGPRGDLLPGGVAGELLLGGGGLARGYLGRPDLTAERFVPDPWSFLPGARLYRTGDLVRCRGDGELEFLGRIDHQAKVRGFRIEPGEIEAVLGSLTGIREAIVAVRESPAGDSRLVAYVVGDGAAGMLQESSLRQALRDRLPDYMVPALFIELPALPRTPNGKVDRKSLPAPSRESSTDRKAAPRTPIEEVVAGIWSEVLGIDPVGIRENFFDLGGHSLVATRVVSRLRRAFGVELPLRALFERPTVAELSAAVEALGRAGSGEAPPPLVPLPREGPPPLSFAQERLWFIDQITPGGALYNIPAALCIRGPLDLGALALALQGVVGRHEALRTRFAVRAGSPVQVIRPAEPVGLPSVDLSGLPGRDRTDRSDLVARLIREEARRPFDLRTGPLVRLALLRLGAAEQVLILTLHHIASDGWSMGLLVHEITALYAAFVAGRPSLLAELPVQYGDFAAWQRSWLQGAVLEREVTFWRRQLAGLPPLLELPTDRPRPAVQSHRGGSRPVRLPADLTLRMKALSRREGATLFMVLLAGFQALLARYSGQRDLAVGTPVAGRNRVETEGLIGFFVNTLVLRSDLDENLTFRDLLRQGRSTALAAYHHQDVPFEKLVQELAPKRSLVHAPLFQVMLTLQNAPSRPIDLPGLTVELMPVETGGAKFDLTLGLQEAQGGALSGALEYDAALFDGSTMDRLIDHLLRLCAAAATQPDLRLSELPLLSPQQLHQVLIEGRGRAGDGLRTVGLHQLFERQAERCPDAPALSYRGRSMTYRDLDREANRLAHRLIDRGTGAEVRVGLCLDRSPEMVVGILAVLKAGGAYVPLDPELPRERLLFQLADAGAAAVVTVAARRPTMTDWEGPIVCLDESPGASGDRSEVPPARAAAETGGDGLAYVLYTSGSTGRPKGVAVTHWNVVRLLEVTREAFGFGPDDVWTLFHSYAFDFSVWELWGALAHGGKVVVVPQDVARSPEEFFRLLETERVTVLNQTPSAFRQLAPVWDAAAETGGGPPVRWVIFGGEALEMAGVSSWLGRRGPLPRLVNMYGITETTVHVTLRQVRIEDGAGPARSLIGEPLGDLELYLLDRALTPQPPGIPGELCVGGEGLARGYWRRAPLTAERFVPDPWSGRPGARLYRSGDLGRRLPGGDVEYLGRIDHQVKIRGLRIELGEIEATLARHPSVRASVVRAVDRPGVAGDRRLVAWVAVEPGTVGAAELKAFIAERLADYMVPASFALMDALPLTVNGKVDRAALVVPEGLRPELAVSFVAPRTREEMAVAAAWQEVLGVEKVGVYDNFFDLGGHSLLMVQVQSRLRDAFAREVAVLDLFQHPTAGDLARHLGALAEETPGPIAFAASELRGESRRTRAAGQQNQRLRRRAGRTGDFEA